MKTTVGVTRDEATRLMASLSKQLEGFPCHEEFTDMDGASFAIVLAKEDGEDVEEPPKMVTVLDVASSLLVKCGTMPTMKLQKLVYYAQAWSLVWDEKPLFGEHIQAWANGPICPDLYFAHNGKFDVEPDGIDGDATSLSVEQEETVQAVVDYYGDKSSHWLIQLTHAESPWKRARGNLEPGEQGVAEITHAEMVEYYGSL